jgi:hypothetical protein
VRECVLALAVTLGGCSASELVQNWTPPPVADLSQPNYRRIIADSIKSIFPNQDALGEMEISGIRPVDHLKGAAWIVASSSTPEATRNTTRSSSRAIRSSTSAPAS